MSPPGVVVLFSRTVLATEKLPTSQPARVYVTHGAGAFFWLSVIRLGSVSLGAAATGDVQYLNADEKVGVVSGL